MKSKSVFFLVWFLFFSLFILPPAGASRSRHYALHEGPGLKFRIVGNVRRGETIRVLKKKAGWVKVRTTRGAVGWISQRTYHRGWKSGKRGKVKVEIKFQNIPQACAEIMKDQLKRLQKRLSPVGDNNLELIVSAVPRLHSYRIFLVVDFNPRYYRHVRKRFNLPTTIDLLPYNNCIWALYAYKQDLLRVANRRLPTCHFIRRFSLSLILKGPRGREVILETSEDGVYIYFSPLMVLKMPDGKLFRVMSEEPKKVALLSAFVLPYPLEKGDPGTVGAYEVYRFFRARP